MNFSASQALGKLTALDDVTLTTGTRNFVRVGRRARQTSILNNIAGIQCHPGMVKIGGSVVNRWPRRAQRGDVFENYAL